MCQLEAALACVIISLLHAQEKSRTNFFITFLVQTKQWNQSTLNNLEGMVRLTNNNKLWHTNSTNCSA